MRKLFLIMIAVLTCAWNLSAQTKTIHGTVVDAGTNEPLIGATVMPIGGGQGAACDLDGKFTLSVPANVTKATVSYVGYTSKTVELRNGMNVQLASSDSNLDEVVVVAYGTANKESLTGSVAVVGAKEIEDRPVTTVTAALEGNAPGVQVNNTYGTPGSAPSIRIRGFSSVNGDNNPLYIVDGIEYAGSIADLNPNDIESMSVLKDAASCALYGNKGANGVVLITTKKAKKVGKIDVSLSISQGMYNRGLPMYERLGANDWMEASFQAKMNELTYKDQLFEGDRAGAAQYLVNNFLSASKARNNIYGVPDNELFTLEGKLIPTAPLAGYTDLDWWPAVSRSGYRQEYNVNAAAASDAYNVFASISYLKENGYVLRTNFERFTGRINANFMPASYFRFGVNLNGVAQNSEINDGAGSSQVNNIFAGSQNMAPIYPVYAHDEEGNIIYENGERVWNTAGYLGNNNIALALRKDFTACKRYMLDGNVYGTAVIPYGFELTVRGSMNRWMEEDTEYLNNVIGSSAGMGNLTFTTGNTEAHTFMQSLNWSHEYGLHHVDALLHHENTYFKQEVNATAMRDQSFDDIYYLSNFVTWQSSNSGVGEDATESYLARARYNWNNQYFGELSFRRDGSSRFAKGNRWGNFWSIGASWIISKEKFMRELDWVNYAKLRLAYGSVGNNASVGYYATYALYGLSQYFGTPTLSIGNLPSYDIRWEATKTFDIALEGALFNDRLNFSVGYFDKRSSDLLFAITQPTSVGTPSMAGSNSSITTNIGTMSNRGWEISLSYDILRNQDWSWSVSADATFLKNKILKLPNHDDIIGGIQRQREGKSIYEFCTYHYAGVDQLTGDALYLLTPDSPEFETTDADGNTVFNEKLFETRLDGARDDDSLVEMTDANGNPVYYVKRTMYASKVWKGTALPTVYGSFGTNLRWRSLSLGVLFTYSLGGKVYDSTYSTLMSASDATSALHKDILKAWNGVPEGMTADSPNRIDPNGVPQFNYATTNDANAASDRFLTSAGYLVLKNINVNWDLPQNWVRPLQLSNLALGFACDNLFTVTARKGLNPQYSYSGGQSQTFVTARVFSFSLTARF